jgi:hypothetical protein
MASITLHREPVDASVTVGRDKAALANAVVQEESLASVLDLDSLRQILA